MQDSYNNDHEMTIEDSTECGEAEIRRLNSNATNGKRFCVRKWSAIALWAWDIVTDNCAICRNHIMDKCIECQSLQEQTNLDESCAITWGKCMHVFHLHCISKWINTRQVCPLDNRPWEYKTISSQ